MSPESDPPIPTASAAAVQPSAPKADLSRRVRTAVVALPLVGVVIFLTPAELAFVVFLAAFCAAAYEFLQLARPLAPSAPLLSLIGWIPLCALAIFAVLQQQVVGERLGMWLIAATGAPAIAASLTVLSSRAAVRDALAAIGILSFAIPIFALPPVGLYRLQALDPWLLVLLLIIVWSSDTAAYFGGRAFGRHKLAPVISPNKTWEGAVAGFAAGLAAAALWSWIRWGEPRAGVMAVAAVTAVAAQLGDLIESMIKRGAGVKDSSNLLPGHGGFYDRLDAMLLAVPAFVLGLWALGLNL